MKRIISFLLVSIVLCGCVQNNNQHTYQPNTIGALLAEQTEENTQAEEAPRGEEAPDNTQALSDIGNTLQEIPALDVEDIEEMSNSGEVDIDLTGMSSDMIYASVFNIMNSPDRYVGKTMKVEGTVAFLQDPDGSKYAAVMISDAAACCANGIEFQLGKDGENKCPEDYPEEGANVVVTGLFDDYVDKSLGATYYHLGNSVLD